MKFIQPDWPAPKHIKAFTTTRLGWPSSYPYEADKLNHSDESQRLSSLLDLRSEPIWLKQTHSNKVIVASQSMIGTEADAAYSKTPDNICIVMTADCLPILLCDKQGTQVAAIHAGWRGLANNIIENTVSALTPPASEFMAWLGPAISPSYFEVGRDVYDAFTSKDSDAARAFTLKNDDKWTANLYLLASMRLQKLGITDIFGGQYCTYGQPDLFYSYRRDKGKTGRMSSLIWVGGNES